MQIKSLKDQNCQKKREMKKSCIVNTILIQITLVLLIGCNDQTEIPLKEKIDTIVKNYYGKEIIFPDSLCSYHRGAVSMTDSTFLLNMKFKIITFISGECTPCIRKLYEWEAFHQEFEKYSDVQLVFVIQSVNHEYFIQMFQQDIPYKFYLLFDPDNEFFRTNILPSEKLFQSMLLDIENKIIITGNPLYNKKLKELYINILNNNSYEKK